MEYVICNTSLDGCIKGNCPYIRPILVNSIESVPKCPYVPTSRIIRLTERMDCFHCINSGMNKHMERPEEVIKCWKMNFKVYNI